MTLVLENSDGTGPIYDDSNLPTCIKNKFLSNSQTVKFLEGINISTWVIFIFIYSWHRGIMYVYHVALGIFGAAPCFKKATAQRWPRWRRLALGEGNSAAPWAVIHSWGVCFMAVMVVKSISWDISPILVMIAYGYYYYYYYIINIVIIVIYCYY